MKTSFANNGLFKLYDLLAEKSLIMTVDHYDPIEIGELLNTMILQYAKEPLSDDILEHIEEAMCDAEDEEEYVWKTLQSELATRQLALIELMPIIGFWRDRALIIIQKDKMGKWTNRGCGDYGLLPFYT